MTSTVILDDLAAITETFCQANGVPLFSFDVCSSHELPRFVDRRAARRRLSSFLRTLCASCPLPMTGRILSAPRWKMRAYVTA